MCITETWLCDDIGESDASIPGYNCIRCDRNIHGAGSALFLSDKLEYQITLYGPKEQEFLLVSVFSTNNVKEKVCIGLWYQPGVLDDLYSIFESLDISVFLVLYSWEITFVITPIHFLASYLVFFT